VCVQEEERGKIGPEGRVSGCCAGSSSNAVDNECYFGWYHGVVYFRERALLCDFFDAAAGVERHFRTVNGTLYMLLANLRKAKGKSQHSNSKRARMDRLEALVCPVC